MKAEYIDKMDKMEAVTRQDSNRIFKAAPSLDVKKRIRRSSPVGSPGMLGQNYGFFIPACLSSSGST